MQAQHLQIAHNGVMSDFEWIALESLHEETRNFIFEDDMLVILMERGMAEPREGRWRVTPRGREALADRAS